MRTLAIEKELKPGYLKKPVEPIKIGETKKSYICFRASVISSIYPESNALYSLSKILKVNGGINFDGNPEAVLQVISRLPNALCVSFFPVILNCLFKLMSNGHPTISPLTVIGVVSTLTK